MSLYDKASLVQIPSGTKSGTLYSVLPANGDGDFDHTRATSATRVNKDGLIESVASGVPRLDYPLIDGVVQSCPALLLEPSRTNLITYSEDFTQSGYWLVSTMNVTPNDAVAPDGNQTADKIEATGAGSVRTSSYTGTSGYAFSVFVKKGNSTYVTLRAFGFTTSIIVGFNLDTLTAQTGGVIEDYGNDWYKLSISKDISSDADKSGFFYIYLPNSLGSTTTVSGNYAYFWGAQLEDATYETSYIPTSGSTVTRNADVCNGAGTSAEFNDSEGVLFAEISALANSGGLREIAVSNGSNSQAVQIKYTPTANRINATIATTSGTVGMTFDVPSLLDYHKICLKYKASDFALWVDGFEVNTNITVNDTPSGLNQLDFDRADGVNDFYGNTKQIMTFNQALTDSELEQVTSWTSFIEMAKGQLYTIE